VARTAQKMCTHTVLYVDPFMEGNPLSTFKAVHRIDKFYSLIVEKQGRVVVPLIVDHWVIAPRSRGVAPRSRRNNPRPSIKGHDSNNKEALTGQWPHYTALALHRQSFLTEQRNKAMALYPGSPAVVVFGVEETPIRG
jgi:hypothetical protein